MENYMKNKYDVRGDDTQESFYNSDPVSSGCKQNVETVKMSTQKISSDSRFQVMPGDDVLINLKQMMNNEHIKYDDKGTIG